MTGAVLWSLTELPSWNKYSSDTENLEEQLKSFQTLCLRSKETEAKTENDPIPQLKLLRVRAKTSVLILSTCCLPWNYGNIFKRLVTENSIETASLTYILVRGSSDLLLSKHFSGCVQLLANFPSGFEFHRVRDNGSCHQHPAQCLAHEIAHTYVQRMT